MDEYDSLFQPKQRVIFPECDTNDPLEIPAEIAFCIIEILRNIRQWAEILDSFESTAPMISALLKTENAYFDENDRIVICYSQSLTKTMLSLPDKFRAFCQAASVALDRPIDEKSIIFELVKKGEAPSDAKILADELNELAEGNND